VCPFDIGAGQVVAQQIVVAGKGISHTTWIIATASASDPERMSDYVSQHQVIAFASVWVTTAHDAVKTREERDVANLQLEQRFARSRKGFESLSSTKIAGQHPSPLPRRSGRDLKASFAPRPHGC
jgi:hypothetical protein